MRINAIIFLIILFSIHCTSRPKIDSDSPRGVDSLTDTINDATFTDSVGRILRGHLLFQVDVQQFFRKNAINDIGYGETSLKYLMPLAFYKDSLHFYIPDASRLTLNVLDINGEFSDSIRLPFKDFTFYKIERFHSFWYLLDIDKGLSVLDDQVKLKYQEEKTIDFHKDESFANIYFENRLNDDRALLDQRGVLKKPLKIDYLNCRIEKSMLFGISARQDNQYTVVKMDLEKGTQSDYLSFEVPCDKCFILPSFLDENRIISSTDKPSVRDQISFINQANLSVSHYLLEYPIEVKRLASDVSLSVSYSGYMYFYDKPSKVLYSLCTDRNTIKVFSFDLNNLK